MSIQDEKYDHLEESDIEKVKEAVAKKREWMEAKMQAQQVTPLTADPIAKISEIRMTMEVSFITISDHVK